MSQPWKLLPLAAIVAAIGALLLAPGGATSPDRAFAEIDCSDPKGIIQVQIRDLDDGNNPVSQAGITVRITPDPQDNAGTRDYVDNGTNDDSNTVGTIRENEACASSANDYTASIVAFPNSYECDEIVGEEDFAVSSGSVTTVELYVGNCEAAATSTPTGTVTTTPGPADEVTVSASPTTVSCSGTSIVTIQVRDSDGDPVPTGTAVEITASIGSISPSSGQTVDDTASAFVFFTAPASQGGTATITAKSGSAQGTTTITVNCGATPTPVSTTAPPPTVAPGGGVISPPNTGSAGLAASRDGAGWVAIASFIFMTGTAAAALGIARVRA